MPSRTRRPSPAMLVAVLALFISLGGNSYAVVKLANNSVSSKTIKNGQVKRADLAKNAVSTAQVADGSLLTTDFRPGQIPQGPPGPKGDKGDKGFSTIVVRAAAGNEGTTAHCNPGEVATGGGATSFTGFVDESAPVFDPKALFVQGMPSVVGYTPSAWSAHASDGGVDADVTVWVVCAAP